MPWLTCVDELPRRPARVLVAGSSGSGKSTLARHIASTLQLRYVELDALHHGPNWTPRPQFTSDVAQLVAEPRWVTEWQYPAVRDLLADHADLLIFLNLPRRLVTLRVLRRTVSRRLRGTELWNGNHEPPLRAVLSNRDHIVRWAWRTHHDHLPRITQCVEQRPALPVVRLTSPAEITAWTNGPLPRAGTVNGG